MDQQDRKSAREGRLGEYLVQIFNMDDSSLIEFMHRDARGLIQNINKVGVPLLPRWLQRCTHYLREFRGTVNRWITGGLTPQDYDDILAFISDRLKGMNHTQKLLHPRRPSVRRLLISQIKKNPLEPFTRAYLELYDMMQLEDRGPLQFRPRYCEFCHKLFLPIRPTLQKTCSKKCSHLRRYQTYVENLKKQGEKAFREGIQDGEPERAPGASGAATPKTQ